MAFALGRQIALDRVLGEEDTESGLHVVEVRSVLAVNTYVPYRVGSHELKPASSCHNLLLKVGHITHQLVVQFSPLFGDENISHHL